MALIKCKECGKEISDTAKACPNCGAKIKAKKFILKNYKKTIIISFLIIFVIVGVIISGIMINEHNKELNRQYEEQQAKELSKQYKENLNTITYKMLSGAADSETCGNLIKKVWSNSIWKEDDPETDKYTKKNGVFNDDFNDSLAILFADIEFSIMIDNIKQNQSDVNKLMKELKNPPDEWKDAYDDLKIFYNDYLTLTNLCINPSGSLQTFSTNFINADTNTLNGYNKMKTYMD